MPLIGDHRSIAAYPSTGKLFLWITTHTNAHEHTGTRESFCAAKTGQRFRLYFIAWVVASTSGMRGMSFLNVCHPTRLHHAAGRAPPGRLGQQLNDAHNLNYGSCAYMKGMQLPALDLFNSKEGGGGANSCVFFPFHLFVTPLHLFLPWSHG